MAAGEQELQKLVEAVAASAKYSQVSPDLIRAIGRRELTVRRSWKAAVKATKTKTRVKAKTKNKARGNRGRTRARPRGKGAKARAKARRKVRGRNRARARARARVRVRITVHCANTAIQTPAGVGVDPVRGDPYRTSPRRQTTLKATTQEEAKLTSMPFERRPRKRFAMHKKRVGARYPPGWHVGLTVCSNHQRLTGEPRSPRLPETRSLTDPERWTSTISVHRVVKVPSGMVWVSPSSRRFVNPRPV